MWKPQTFEGREDAVRSTRSRTHAVGLKANLLLPIDVSRPEPAAGDSHAFDLGHFGVLGGQKLSEQHARRIVVTCLVREWMQHFRGRRLAPSSRLVGDQEARLVHRFLWPGCDRVG